MNGWEGTCSEIFLSAAVEEASAAATGATAAAAAEGFDSSEGGTI